MITIILNFMISKEYTDLRANLKTLYWFIIFTLLFVPVTHSFFVNIKNMTNSMTMNNEYKMLLRKLNDENSKLSNKVNYYNTSDGIKALIKDRLNKVESGEVIIKFSEKRGNKID